MRPQERGAESDYAGRRTAHTLGLRLPEGWAWLPLVLAGVTDDEGWQYAFNWKNLLGWRRARPPNRHA